MHGITTGDFHAVCDLDVFHVHLQPRWGYGRGTLAKVLTYIRDEAGRVRFRS